VTGCIAPRLRQAAADLPSERVSLQSLAQAHGPATHGTLLLLMAAPCLLPVPGVGTVLGLGLAALAIAMWRGQAAEHLPGRVARLELPRDWAQRVLVLLAATYAAAGRLARARLTELACAGRRSWTAAMVGLMPVIVVLPIPFGNVLPALALMLIGLALVFRDGAAMLLGMTAAAFALVTNAGLVSMAWFWGGEWITRRALP